MASAMAEIMSLQCLVLAVCLLKHPRGRVASRVGGAPRPLPTVSWWPTVDHRRWRIIRSSCRRVPCTAGYDEAPRGNAAMGDSSRIRRPNNLGIEDTGTTRRLHRDRSPWFASGVVTLVEGRASQFQSRDAREWGLRFVEFRHHPPWNSSSGPYPSAVAVLAATREASRLTVGTTNPISYPSRGGDGHGQQVLREGQICSGAVLYVLRIREGIRPSVYTVPWQRIPLPGARSELEEVRFYGA